MKGGRAFFGSVRGRRACVLATIGFPALRGSGAGSARPCCLLRAACVFKVAAMLGPNTQPRSAHEVAPFACQETYIFLSALPKVPEMKNQKQTTTAYADDTGPRMAGSETRELWDLLWPRNQPGNLA